MWRSLLVRPNFNIPSIICRVMAKRKLSGDENEQTTTKNVKIETSQDINGLKHDKNRLIPDNVLRRLSEEDIKLISDVKTSCTDLERIQAAIKLRISHRLCARLPHDDDDSTYYIKDGLRWVYPYPYIYQTFARRRWLGKKLASVISQEFRDIPDRELADRFKKNYFLVRGEIANIDHVLRDNDFICHMVHRHELPVLATPIKIIHEDDETLVINKPPSVPIHPCGRFRHNSVVNILKKEYNFDNVKVVHRLDRLVSGVLIMAKNSIRAHKFENAISQREVEKVYVCRVSGEFPLGDEDNDGEITVDEPLEYVPGKIGISVVMKDARPSTTKFKRLHYNGKTSAVLCKPLTGRMHQIRVHLQYLGHPIVNDVLYNCDSFGPMRGKGGQYGKSLGQLSNDVVAKHRADTWLIQEGPNYESDANENQQPSPNVDDEPDVDQAKMMPRFVDNEERQETMAALEHFFTDESSKDLENRWQFEPAKMVQDPDCRDCRDKFHEPPPRRLFMYLHALKYSGPGFSYESELPSWARDSWAH